MRRTVNVNDIHDDDDICEERGLHQESKVKKRIIKYKKKKGEIKKKDTTSCVLRL